MEGDGWAEGGVGQAVMKAGEEGVEELQEDVLELESGTWNAGTELACRMQVLSTGRDIVWLAFLGMFGEPAGRSIFM